MAVVEANPIFSFMDFSETFLISCDRILYLMTVLV